MTQNLLEAQEMIGDPLSKKSLKLQVEKHQCDPLEAAKSFHEHEAVRFLFVSNSALQIFRVYLRKIILSAKNGDWDLSLGILSSDCQAGGHLEGKSPEVGSLVKPKLPDAILFMIWVYTVYMHSCWALGRWVG